jgi:small subunit ribosomal protein S20
VARSLSSQKRQRQSVTRAVRNKARKTAIKTKVRKVKDTIQAHDVASAETALRDAARTLDRNANHKTIHPNTAARRKSRLAKQVNALKAGTRK